MSTHHVTLDPLTHYLFSPPFTGNFRGKVLESNMVAQVRVVSRTDNVAGVKLPVFSQYNTGAEQPENLG